ncbi:TlpA family protein disulfide reductase [Pedobacter psychroterrae]|uniref:TlpA family protein disulfide reductase n=1 Tax=Pedobacter psychroterrae TaxID=2530453 RepID=A0A4R0NTL8_9SPHI|nr:TlpA disulfide reductase family protein [Pedobacter psychroterrae]TCD03509.1 TlpA family protein disulfide reductase [Pedobacter psychroterrae]
MILKKIYSSAMLLLATLPLLAQLPVEINGQLNKERKSPLKLFKIVEGKPLEIAVSTPGDKGRFGFLFYPEYEGFYLVGTGAINNPADSYKFYFKPGDKLSLSISDSSYVLNGNRNSKENVVMAQWHDLVFPLEQKSINFFRVNSTFIDFFPELEDIVAKSKIFLNGKKTGNAKFDKVMIENIKWDMAHYAVSFLNTPRTAHPSVEEYSPYYTTLTTQGFAKNALEVYQQPWGARILAGLVMVNMRLQNVKFTPGLEGLKNALSFIPNDTLKGDAVLENAMRYKNYTDYKELMEVYGKYILTAAQKKRNLDIATPLLTLKPGDDAYAFAYPDKEGKTVSMASLRGKVVLVDVWATWCGPCKAEIPHLKKLEKEMEGKDVEIISLSTDALKDKEKWLKMIKDENLGGTQLFAGGPGNEFSQYYKVNSIPRFLVFDQKGKIVSVDSPRPSNPALKALLEKTLTAKQ